MSFAASPLCRRRSLLGYTLLLLCLPLGACAGLTLPPAMPAAGPKAADFPDAGAVILEDEATLSYRWQAIQGAPRQLVAVLDHRRKVKVLREEGLAEAHVRLPVDGSSTVQRLIARSVAPGGGIIELDSRHLWSSQYAGVNKAPEVRCLHFEVPGVQVGGQLEYRYERVYADPWNVPPWIFGSRLPTQKSTFGVVSPASVRVDILHGRGDQKIDRAPSQRDQYGNAQRLVFREEDVPAFFVAPDSVHVAHRAPWLAVGLRSVRRGGRAQRMQSWPDVAERVTQEMAKVEAPAGVGGTLQRLRQVRRALVPMTLPGLSLRPAQPAARLEEGAAASSRDAAAYAQGRLGQPKGARGAAKLLLLTGPGAPPFAEDFPAPYPLMRAALVLRAEPGWQQGLQCEGSLWHRDFLCGAEPGSPVYFAPDCPECPLGVLPPGYAGSRALEVDAAGQATWVDVDVGAPQRHALNQEARWTMDLAGNLTGTLDAEAHGQPAAAWRQALADMTSLDAEQRGAGAAAAVHYYQIYGDGVAPRADGLAVRGLDDLSKGIWAHGQLSAQVPRPQQDTFAVRPADLVGESIPASWRRPRHEPVVLPGPRWQETLALVTLPLGVEAPPAAPIRLGHHIAEYAAGYVQHGRTLKFSRRFVLKKAVLDAADWQSFADFFEQIRAYEQTAWLLSPPQAP